MEAADQRILVWLAVQWRSVARASSNRRHQRGQARHQVLAVMNVMPGVLGAKVLIATSNVRQHASLNAGGLGARRQA
jgi:hypothetical protein